MALTFKTIRYKSIDWCLNKFVNFILDDLKSNLPQCTDCSVGRSSLTSIKAQTAIYILQRSGKTNILNTLTFKRLITG